MVSECFSALIDPLPVPIALVSAEATVLAMNRAMRSMLCCGKKDIHQAPLANFMHDAPEKVLQYLQLCSSSSSLTPGRLVFRTQDGKKVPCRCQGAAVAIQSDSSCPIILHCVPQKTNLTQFAVLNEKVSALSDEIRRRTTVEAELQSAHDVLEQRVLERTNQLENLYKELHAASRQAGMAEVATGILHNVGNVLNSVNTSTGIITQVLNNSQVKHFGTVTELIQQHEHDFSEYVAQDTKGQLLPHVLMELNKALTGEHGELLNEFNQLTKDIEHIKNIVAMQQSYATQSGVIEQVAAEQLFDDALRINLQGLSRHQISLVQQFHETPAMTTDRHRVLQILVNLISNAKYAMDQKPPSTRTLTVRIEPMPGHLVRFTVVDTGEGISAENLTKIFTHGFTTKKNGHGFGLHMAAIAARELGGTLTVSSDGPDQGAVFILDLPVHAQLETTTL